MPGLSETMRPRVLLVDDEQNILNALSRALRRTGWEIHTASDAAGALAIVGGLEAHVVVSDYRMPGVNGVDLLHEVKLRAPLTQRVLLTGQADSSAIEEAINHSEIFRFISKPWDDAQLLLTLQNAVEQALLVRENARLEQVTKRQNEELRALNTDLEARVTQRTAQLSLASREWQLCFDSIEAALAIIRTSDGAVLRANRAYAETAAGAGEALVADGRTPCHQALFGSATACPGCPLPHAVSSRSRARAEIAMRQRLYSVEVYPLLEGDERAVCVYRDITEERAMMLRLVETEKMAAVGRLSGGVAHEINNPLGGILAFSQLMQRDAGRSATDLEQLKLIEDSALRCKRIVESLLTFSRRSRAEERWPQDLNRCMEETVVLFRAQLRSHPEVALVLELGEGLPKLACNPLQISQVALNLLQNGLDEVKHRGGSLRVLTGVDPGGGGLWFSVKDDGRGIAPADLPLIFEPTFTTKPPGEGTGLGLSIAHRIIEDHGGRIDVETVVGEGTTFTVRLPVS